VQLRDPSVHIPLVCVSLWLLGLWCLNVVLNRAGSMYPMIDAATPNWRYSGELHRLVVNMALGWTAVCIALGWLWAKARNR